MRNLLGIAAAAGFAFAALGTSAQAMPTAPLSVESQDVQKVADGCGRGWRLNAYGECVPIRAARRYYRRHYWGPAPYWGWGRPRYYW